MNLQVIASPDGDILWVSGALPGSVHDKKAEWVWGVLAELEAAGLIVLADKGYQAARTRKSRTRARTSRNHRKTPTKPTRNYGHPANARTQDLAHPPQAPLLPLARRATRQSQRSKPRVPALPSRG
jgi:hypothetical protein